MAMSHWPVKVGQTLKRRKLHSLVGGAHQWGITSCLNGKAMLVFCNPKKSKEFGYDKWEGRQSDGQFHYTGQGVRGNQEISAGANRSLLRSREIGRPIHLFESQGTEVTYVGQYELATDAFRWESAPDETGHDRRVVVFHMVKVEIDHA